MKKSAIVGLGLIGGSLAKALKRSGQYVIGIPHRQETLDKAKESSAVDEASMDLKAVAEADIIFICTPMNLIIPKLEETAPYLKKGAVVTDVGSSKYEIVSRAEKIMPKGTYFVGGHPMAGKEKVKFEESDADLFKDKIWILTETSRTSSRALELVEGLIRYTEAKIVRLDPKRHDLAVAAISHMPLAIASSLVNAVANEPEKELMAKVAASGFRDTTRVASGDPELGVDMFMTNKKPILKMIKAFKSSLLTLEKLIKEGDPQKIREELEKAKKFRDPIFG